MRRKYNFEEKIEINFILKTMNMSFDELKEELSEQRHHGFYSTKLEDFFKSEEKYEIYKNLIVALCCYSKKLPLKMLNFLMYRSLWVNNYIMNQEGKTYFHLSYREDLTKSHIVDLFHRNNNVPMHRHLANNPNVTKKMLKVFMPKWEELDDSKLGAAAVAKQRIITSKHYDNTLDYFVKNRDYDTYNRE